LKVLFERGKKRRHEKDKKQLTAANCKSPISTLQTVSQPNPVAPRP
jgi:hypothetical protein